MEYINQFNDDFNDGKISVHHQYMVKNVRNGEMINDVVTDITDKNKLYSSACLPIARQITNSEQKLTIRIPKIGDLFLGIVDNKVIDHVIYHINNYTDEFILEGQRITVNDVVLWRITSLPIPLLNIDDYDNINIKVEIITNKNYNLQNSNKDVFEVYYGYFNQKIKEKIIHNMVYEIPILDEQSILNIICGLWTIKPILENLK